MKKTFLIASLPVLIALLFTAGLIQGYYLLSSLQVEQHKLRREVPMTVFLDPQATLSARQEFLEGVRKSPLVDSFRYVPASESYEIARNNPVLRPILAWVGTEATPAFYKLYLSDAGFMQRDALEKTLDQIRIVWSHRIAVSSVDYYQFLSRLTESSRWGIGLVMIALLGVGFTLAVLRFRATRNLNYALLSAGIEMAGGLCFAGGILGFSGIISFLAVGGAWFCLSAMMVPIVLDIEWLRVSRYAKSSAP